MKYVKRAILGAVLCCLCFLSVGSAQIAVVDAGAIGQFIRQVVQLQQEYALLYQTYQTTIQAYNILNYNRQMLTSKYAWSYLASPMFIPTAPNTMGTTAGWMTTLNKGLNGAIAFQMATIQPTSPARMLGQLSAAAQSDWGRHQATIDLNDGLAQHVMTVTGTARSNSTSRALALSRLQSDSLSDALEQNTETGLLNKINSATLVHAQSVQDTNTLLEAMADQQTIDSKLRHDVLVDEMNAAIASQGATQSNMSALFNGDNAARSARLP